MQIYIRLERECELGLKQRNKHKYEASIIRVENRRFYK